MKKGVAWWGTPYIKIFQNLSYPVILLDRDLTFKWANAAAETLFTPEIINDVSNEFILNHYVSVILDQLIQNPPIQLASQGLLGGSYDCQITPALNDECPDGYIIKLFKDTFFDNHLQADGIDHTLATFAHQTRNPLSTIFSALSGITRCNDELEDPDIREYVSKITTQCYRLLRSSTNITEINRFQFGLSVFSPRKQDLCLFLEQLCRIVSVMIESIGIRFRYSVPGEPIITMFDSEKISTAVLNLISNAAKFIGGTGEILIVLSINNGHAVITVSDNGLGINNRILQRVFDPYFSYDPHTTGICGDGLGLTLCKMIVLEHSGTISVNSCEGVGSKVMFTLPLKCDESTQLTISDVANEYLCDRFSNMFVILSDVCKTPDV
ncbi:HAMP domain-containing sensor histidine kinase [Hydrogenoanaerobacterium sp.]|uniref:sensor histidine kinase n=1 Tax=Hydrogenoanaerobacterium sp. TaxID=2953763 RepID=UPI00289F52A1|nr:HAMP domain-containing sensor histidine kinase [Hydrogenoanaerobacterium sp.]